MSASLQLLGPNLDLEPQLRQTQFVEDKLIILSGSQICPSRDQCDRIGLESYDSYIRRHAKDHQLGEFEHFEDAERNLFLYCFYAFHKYCIGNPSLSADPFWERHVFMVEWKFAPDDLEQGWDRDRRVYRLADYGQMRPNRVEKRFKKIEAPRGTQKSSIGRAFASYRIIRAFFVENNPYFRVLAISATSRTGRNQWFKPLKTLWSVNRNIVRLFGIWEFTCSHCGQRQMVPDRLRPQVDTCPACERLLGQRVNVRRIGLLTKGSLGVDSIQMRWTVIAASDFSGVAAENFQYLGCDSEIAGQRFDIAFPDDLSTKLNSKTLPLREGIKDTFAEVMKTLDQSSGQAIISCTRKHLDDLAGDIDKPDGPYYEQFHIMHRRASWEDRSSGVTVFYWPVDAQGKRRLDERFLRHELANSSERDFFSEYQNDPQDPTKTPFKSDWFKPVGSSEVPGPVMWGLGGDITDDQKRQLSSMGIPRLQSVLYVDPAGLEAQKARADDTALVGVRFYRGVIYILLLRAFKGSDSKEKENIYQSAVYLQPNRIRYELPVHSKGIENGFANFCREKSQELTAALRRQINVYLPMDFQPISTTMSKHESMTRTEPLYKAGRVVIVAGPECPPVEIAKFREQHVGLGVTSHDDYPDAFCRVLEDFGIPSFSDDAQAAAAPSGEARVNEKGNVELNFSDIFKSMLGAKKQQGANWGRSGYGGSSNRR